MAEWLVADVGGTNTRVALASPDGVELGTIRSYVNAGFDGLTPLILSYLGEVHPKPQIKAICAGVAGPVNGATAQLTNLSWFIDAAELGAATQAHCIHLHNDLQAQGLALKDLAPNSTQTLIHGNPDPHGPRLVLGLGTGCNIAVVHRIGPQLFVPPAEAGHATLPHLPGLEGLMEHLCAKHPHLPVECALSGPGLRNIHEYLTGHRRTPAQIIEDNATETLRLFTRVLGTVAANLCLTHMATGGLFLIGGTARAVTPYLSDLGFTRTFTAKGPYSKVLQDTPVHLITDDTAALRGCARHLSQMSQ